ncbi:MAG: helix-turn-helix domain-containing protein [Planctomycetota bacterium]
MSALPQQEFIDEVFHEIRRYTTCGKFFICGPSRIKSVVRNRALAAGLMREVLKMSSPEIARALHRTSHSTVLTHLKRCETDGDLAAEVARLSANLRTTFWPGQYPPQPDDL